MRLHAGHALILGQLVCGLSLAARTAHGFGISDDSPARSAAEKLTWDLGSWRAIEIRVQQDFVNHDENAAKTQKFNRVEEHYIELRTGGRFADDTFSMNGAYVDRDSYFFAGSKGAAIQYSDKDKQQSAMINLAAFRRESRSDHVDRPVPLLYYYVGRVPLYEALPRSTYLGKGRVGDKDCDLFLFPRVRWSVVQDQVFSLDATTHDLMRVASYQDKLSREKNEPMWVWTADLFEAVQGRTLPMKSSEVSYGPERKIAFTRTYTVQEIRFDGDYPASMFRPDLQPGVTIMDADAKKVSRPSAKKEPERPQTRASAAPPEQSIVATSPVNWLTIVSRSAVAVGLALVAVGGIVWYRRRS